MAIFLNVCLCYMYHNNSNIWAALIGVAVAICDVSSSSSSLLPPPPLSYHCDFCVPTGSWYATYWQHRSINALLGKGPMIKTPYDRHMLLNCGCVLYRVASWGIQFYWGTLKIQSTIFLCHDNVLLRLWWCTHKNQRVSHVLSLSVSLAKSHYFFSKIS